MTPASRGGRFPHLLFIFPARTKIYFNLSRRSLTELAQSRLVVVIARVTAPRFGVQIETVSPFLEASFFPSPSFVARLFLLPPNIDNANRRLFSSLLSSLPFSYQEEAGIRHRAAPVRLTFNRTSALAAAAETVRAPSPSANVSGMVRSPFPAPPATPGPSSAMRSPAPDDNFDELGHLRAVLPPRQRTQQAQGARLTSEEVGEDRSLELEAHPDQHAGGGGGGGGTASDPGGPGAVAGSGAVVSVWVPAVASDDDHFFDDEGIAEVAEVGPPWSNLNVSSHRATSH